MKNHFLFLLITILLSCSDTTTLENKPEENSKLSIDKTSLVILGTVQDAGSPQIGCKKKCCKGLFENPDHTRQVISLGLIDAENNKTYLFDASPDMGKQMKRLTQYEKNSEKEIVDGIFLTHAHIGQSGGFNRNYVTD